jgi:hypothetical protein
VHPAHVLAAYQPATVYGHPVPQSAGAAIAILFLVGLAIVVARGLASFSKGKS